MSTKTVNICRTCLSTDGELISLFSDVSETTHLPNKIMNISDITISKKDGLPYMICKKCVFLIESFDCFKKQIESANERVKDFWRTSNKESEVRKVKLAGKVENFIGDDGEDYDDSEYEIQYISDEVKRDVENAFKKKRQKELAKICKNLKNYGDVILIPIQDKNDEKKRQSDCKAEGVNIEADKVSSKIEKNIGPNVTSHYLSEFNENIPHNVPENIDVTKVDNFYNDEADTIQSANSDCNERLTIEIEETDDPSEKLLEPEYVGLGGNFEGEKGTGIEQKDLAPSIDREETLGEMEISMRKSLDPLDLGCDDDDKKTDHPQSATYGQHLADLQNIVHRGARSLIDSMEHKENNIFETSSHIIEGKVVKPCKTDKIEEDFLKPGEYDAANEFTMAEKFIDKQISHVENSHKKTEEVTATAGPLKIVEETIGPEKSDNEKIFVDNEKLNNNNEERVITDNDMRSNALRPEDANGDKMEIENESEAMENIDKKCLRPNNGETGIARNEKFPIVQKTNHIDEKMANITKLTNQDKDAMISQKGVENGISVKSLRNDNVIVISSDTSDEERRKNYLETAKRGASLLPRRVRKKLFQSRVALKKSQTRQSHDRKVTAEVGKEQPKKFQPKKYFQCTNCNINLYSVSAVLHHHNQIHTSPNELLSCQMCDVQFATKVDLHAHFDQHVESHLFRCNFCTCEFVLKKNLQTHTNGHVSSKITEPKNKRLKIDEPSGNIQLPVAENVVNTKNTESLTNESKKEPGDDTIDQASEN